MSRSHLTPELSAIAGRSTARWTASPGSGAARVESGTDGSPRSARGDSLKSTSSTVTPNSDAKAYSVRTDGRIFPVSI